MSNAVIYARYSSRGQTEQSIEGQLAVCRKYAASHDYHIISEYIDRALTGTNAEKRDEFQRMIADSAKGQFEVVIVYQLDRFARNRYDSAFAKSKLNKNGVRVISAMESISEGAEGIILESVLEGIAEYYSAELSQKVQRGLEISASKFRFTGGKPPLGFKIDEEQRYQIDPETAPFVQKIYELYAAGSTVKEITDYMNGLAVQTSQGNTFNKNSLRTMLQNKKYIGSYVFKGQETPNAIPRILSDKLFYDVQAKMDKNKRAPARARAKAEYLLTTKLFCGHCKEMMVGVSGTSKTGATHNYYQCKNVLHKKGCSKKNVRKDFIERYVLEKARAELTDENIAIICAEVEKLNRKLDESIEMKHLHKLLKENITLTENLLRALENGEAVDLITERIKRRQQERQELEAEIQDAKWKYAPVTAIEAQYFLEKLREGRIDDEKYRRTLIAIFIDSIYLFDDKIVIGFKTSGQPLSVSYDLIDEISDSVTTEPSSYMISAAPPRHPKVKATTKEILSWP